jgi:GDP-L-fucose synthase
MNILITGCKGFLARELTQYFSNSHNVLETDRTKLDPTNYENVKRFFDLYKVDIVIHTAVKGGKRNDRESIENFFINTRMFENLSLFSDRYKMMFNFGSGAEFDRTLEIDEVREGQINYRNPSDYYGLAKNLISKKVVYLNSNIYNLRLFGCFGQFEEPQRLIRSTYRNFSNGDDAVINRDKMMDYFYAQDVAKVIDFYIQNQNPKFPKDLNLCYNKKQSLSDIAFIIKDLTNTSQNVTIKNNNIGLSYTGSGKKLYDLGIKLCGIKKGINECLRNWNRY